MTGLPRKVHATMTLQGGVGSRKQLLARGFADHAIDTALETQRLYHLHRGHGVYSLVPLELLSDEAVLTGAVLSTDGRAVLAGGTAAHRWELIEAKPLKIQLATTGLELVGPSGVSIRRTVLRPGDVVHDRGFRTMTPARTLLDLATEYHRRPLLRALREAEYHHRMHPDDVLAILRRGHPGSAHLRAALAQHVPGYGEAKRGLERKFRALLVLHDVPLPQRNRKIGPYTVDCVWLDLRVVVELDGGQHLRPAQRVIDADRDLWLRERGYIVRRYTWKQVTGRNRAAVIADLHRAFDEARLLTPTPNFARTSGV